MKLSSDAFSDGQISSKIWLCEELEKAAAQTEKLKIWVYAGWYGLLPFLLLSRGRLSIAKTELFDTDAAAVLASMKINDHFRLTGRFVAHRQDVNQKFFKTDGFVADVLINTSCEHFAEQSWWDHVPAGTMVALQGTNMPHAEHVREYASLEDFRDSFGSWRRVLYLGQKDFSYSSFSFSRFMIIGIK